MSSSPRHGLLYVGLCVRVACRGVMAAPKRVLKALRHVEHVFEVNEPGDVRKLKAAKAATISPIKYCAEEDSSLWFGIAMRQCHCASQAGSGFEVKLARTPWLREMDTWDAGAWAWFIMLVLDKSAPGLRSMGRCDDSSDTCFYSILPHYKMNPADPSGFAAALERELRQLVALPRFSGDRRSFFFGCSGDEAELSFISPEVDGQADPARVFDTSWHWRRAAALLSVDIEDLSQSPGVTYLVGSGDGVRVLGADRQWFGSAREYISHRLARAQFSTGECERVCDFIWTLASAETSLAGLSPLEYAMRFERRRGKHPVPGAMRAAYNLFGISIPEMDEYAHDVKFHKCAACSAPEPANTRFQCCAACKIPRYCSRECQKLHWKAAHKLQCRAGAGAGADPWAVADAKRRQPRESVIQAMLTQLPSAAPLPGTEEAAAYEVCLRRLLAIPGSNGLMRTKVAEAKAAYEARKEELHTRFPDHPRWDAPLS